MPRAVVEAAGEEDRRARSGVRAGRPDEHGRARGGEARAEGVAAAAIVERQGGRGNGAGRREVGAEGVGRAAIAAGSGRADEEKVAVEREGRAETVGGGGVGGGEQRGRAAGRGEAQDCAGACVRGRAEVDGVAGQCDGGSREADVAVRRRYELGCLRPCAVSAALEELGAAPAVIPPGGPDEQPVAVNCQRGSEPVTDLDIVAGDDVGELPAVVSALEDVDAAGRGVDRARHPAAGAADEDLAVADRDGGSESGGSPDRLLGGRVGLGGEGGGHGQGAQAAYGSEGAQW